MRRWALWGALLALPWAVSAHTPGPGEGTSGGGIREIDIGNDGVDTSQATRITTDNDTAAEGGSDIATLSGGNLTFDMNQPWRAAVGLRRDGQVNRWCWLEPGTDEMRCDLDEDGSWDFRFLLASGAVTLDIPANATAGQATKLCERTTLGAECLEFDLDQANLAATIDCLDDTTGLIVNACLNTPYTLGATIDDTELTNEDFGDFSCSGAEDGCTLDPNTVSFGSEIADFAGPLQSVRRNAGDTAWEAYTPGTGSASPWELTDDDDTPVDTIGDAAGNRVKVTGAGANYTRQTAESGGQTVLQVADHDVVIYAWDYDEDGVGGEMVDDFDAAWAAALGASTTAQTPILDLGVGTWLWDGQKDCGVHGDASERRNAFIVRGHGAAGTTSNNGSNTILQMQSGSGDRTHFFGIFGCNNLTFQDIEFDGNNVAEGAILGWACNGGTCAETSTHGGHMLLRNNFRNFTGEVLEWHGDPDGVDDVVETCIDGGTCTEDAGGAGVDQCVGGDYDGLTCCFDAASAGCCTGAGAGTCDDDNEVGQIHFVLVMHNNVDGAEKFVDQFASGAQNMVYMHNEVQTLKDVAYDIRDGGTYLIQEDVPGGGINGTVRRRAMTDTDPFVVEWGRFENQRGDPIVFAGYCSEDAGLHKTARDWCIRDDQCSGTCTYEQNTHASLEDNHISMFDRGEHDGSENAATLSDASGGFNSMPIVDGLTVYNRTDGSSCVISSHTDTTVTCTLTGGTDNDWDGGDNYDIGPAGDGIFRYSLYAKLDGATVIEGNLFGGGGHSDMSKVGWLNEDNDGGLDDQREAVSGNFIAANHGSIVGRAFEVGALTTASGVSNETIAADDNDNTLATTAFVQGELTGHTPNAHALDPASGPHTGTLPVGTVAGKVHLESWMGDSNWRLAPSNPPGSQEGTNVGVDMFSWSGTALNQVDGAVYHQSDFDNSSNYSAANGGFSFRLEMDVQTGGDTITYELCAREIAASSDPDVDPCTTATETSTCTITETANRQQIECDFDDTNFTANRLVVLRLRRQGATDSNNGVVIGPYVTTHQHRIN